jgi:hypothetical protein
MAGSQRAALRRLSHLLRNPSSVAVLAIEHVKRSPCRRVEHVRDELGLLAAF